MTSPLGILAAGRRRRAGDRGAAVRWGPCPARSLGWVDAWPPPCPPAGQPGRWPPRPAGPWRGYVQRVRASEARFAAAVAAARPGPLHDRLAQIGERVAAGAVGEAVEIAGGVRR